MPNNIDPIKVNGYEYWDNDSVQNSEESNEVSTLFDDEMAEENIGSNDGIGITNYDSEEWEDIKPLANKFLGFLWNNNTFTYETENGSKITVSNTDNVVVKRNKETGELVVVGANKADIDVKENDSITIVESTVNKINAQNGDSTINIVGSHTTVGKIIGGDGNQVVNISNGASVDKIKTGDGDDKINLSNDAYAGKIITGDGNDTITAQNSTISNTVRTGDGDDNILINDSKVSGKIKTGSDSDFLNISNSEMSGKIKLGTGDDIVNAENTEFNGKVKLGSGNDTLQLESSTVNKNFVLGSGTNDVSINDSTVSDKTKIKIGSGENNIYIGNSQIDGKLKSTFAYNDVNLEIDNSTIKNIKGFNNFNTEAVITDSAVNGLDGIKGVKHNVTPLDTSIGSEYEGFEIVDASSVFLNTSTYKLADGTTITADSNIGQVYINKDTGEIVLNGINNAKISQGSSAKITAIHSNITEHSNIQSIVEYKNSIAQTIDITPDLGADKQVVFISDGSNISKVNSENSNLNLQITNNSSISKIRANGKSKDIMLSLESGNIGSVKTTGSVNVGIYTAEDNKEAISIGKIITESGNISGDIKNTNINKIKTSSGSIDLKANGGNINTVKNKNQNGTTSIDFTNVSMSQIAVSNKSTINLNSCNVKTIKTSEYDDEISVTDSQINKIKTKNGKDDVKITTSNVSKVKTKGDSNNVLVNNSELEKLKSSGNISIYNADVDKANVSGDIAIEAAEIGSFNVQGEKNNIYIKDSLIDLNNSVKDDNIYVNNFGKTLKINNASKAKSNKHNGAIKTIQELETQQSAELESFLAQYSDEDKAKIKEQIILEMQGALQTLKDEKKDNKESRGIGGLITSVFCKNTELKDKEHILNKAIKSDNLEDLLNAYKILTNEELNEDKIKEKQCAIQYAQSLDNNDIETIINVLSYIGNNMDYSITENDGVIKEIIAQYNTVLDIGTNRNEAIAYLNTYRDNVAALRKAFEAGELTNENFAAEYKRITGHELTQTNVNSLLDNVRNNDNFDNNTKEKISDYQNTQQTVFQVGEYTVVIAAGTAVTLVSGGAAGPAVAAALASLGKMGIALTATTVSFVVKTSLELTERQTNRTVSDDLTGEEVAKSAALMYAGCIAGQFGNLVGKLAGNAAYDAIENVIVKMVAQKIAGLTADSSMMLGFDYLITGEGDFSQEFIVNLKQEAIGYIQSKFTGYYLKAHPEIAKQNLEYNLSKERSKLSTGVASDTEINAQLLKNHGFPDSAVTKLATHTAEEVSLLILIKETTGFDSDKIKQALQDEDSQGKRINGTNEESSEAPVKSRSEADTALKNTAETEAPVKSRSEADTILKNTAETEASPTRTEQPIKIISQDGDSTFIKDPFSGSQYKIESHEEGSTIYKFKNANGDSCEYDSATRRISTFKMNGKPGQQTLKLAQQVELDANGNPVAIRNKFKFHPDGSVKTCKVYDETGSKIKFAEEYYQGGNVLKKLEIYSDDGQSITAEKKFRTNGILQSEMTYKANKQPDTEIEYAEDGKTMNLRRIFDDGQNYKEQTFNQKNQVDTETYFSANKQKLKSSKFEYDSNGNKILETFFDKNGKTTGASKYEYDSSNRITKKINTDYQGNKISQDEYTYHSDGTKTLKKTLFKENGDIASEELYKIDQSGNVIKLNADGTEPLKSENPIYDLITKQIGSVTANDVDGMISQIMSTGATKQEAEFALSMLTKFGNMKSLEGLADSLHKLGIDTFYSGEMGVSANRALYYILAEKAQAPIIAMTKHGSQKAFILDDFGLKYLESIKGTSKFNAIIQDPNIKFINIEGWNDGLNIYNQKYDSSSITDKAIELIARAQTIQKENGITFEEAYTKAVNESTLSRAKALGLPDVTTIKSTDTSTSSESIASHLRPMSISPEKVSKMVDIIAEELYSSDPIKQQKAKQIISGYFESNLDIYSPQRLNEQLVKMKTSIEDQVSQLRKADGSPYTKDDIYYLIPPKEFGKEKSYAQIALQYATVNGIDPSKFICDKIATDIPTLDDGKIYVLMDDVVGSGMSMLTQGNGFQYAYTDFSQMGNRRVIFAPIVSGGTGYSKIIESINSNGRTGKDFIIIDSEQIKTPVEKTDFYSQLSDSDKKIFHQIIEDLEKGGGSDCGAYGIDNKSAYAICFPYMSPDNDAALPSLIFEYLFLNKAAIKNNYYDSNKIAKKIKTRISNIQSQ